MDTKTLMHFNGTNGSTTFTDELGRTWTAHNSAQITTANKVFGTGSGLFNVGTNDYIDTPDSDDFTLGANSFTFDFWAKRKTQYLGATQFLFGQMSSDQSFSSLSIRAYFNYDNKIVVELGVNASYQSATSSIAITDSNWHHVAIVRDVNVLKIYIDGTEAASASITNVIVNNSLYKFAIGVCGELVASGFDGWIEEFRFSNVARWTSGFTPPVGEYLTTYYKTFTATVKSTVSFVKNRLFFKELFCTVASSASIKKTVSKTLSCVVKALGTIHRMMVNFKPLYPILSVTEYPIEMSVTEYPITLEVLGMPKAGSTITLKGTFPDSAGNLTLLADVTVKVYGPGKVLLTTITNVTEVSTGIYTAEYTVPADKIGQFDYEFSGTLGSKTIIGRSSFDSIWK
jgi:hypothetical protein